MSHKRTKIKYVEEGSYGSINKKTLYLHENGVCDINTFYYEDGTPIFLFEDTLEGNIFEKMIEIYHKWKDNPNIENWTEEDRKKLNL